MSKYCRPGPCAKFVLGLFGALLLAAFLFVPCTTTTSSVRTDPNSRLVVRTTYPRNTHVFLPRYLAMKAGPPGGPTVRARSLEWAATMAVVAILGLFDYAVFCRLLRRKRRAAHDSGPDDHPEGPSGDSPPSGFSLPG